jgi:PAS domain S-box-containing protein
MVYRRGRMTSGLEILEALPVAVYLTDAEGHITFYNQAAAELWGHRPKLGTDSWCGSWRLYWPDGRPMAHDECPMAIAIKEGRPVRDVEAVLERPDGTRIPFRPYPTPLNDASGRVTGAINLLVDATQTKQAEIESARLAAIVVSSDDAIIGKTLDGQITSWNAGATRIFGYQADEMIGQSITRVIPPELQQEEDEILAKLRRGEHIDHYETVRIAKDGRRLDISLSVSPLLDKTGLVIGASKIARDITEKKRAEAIQRVLIEELNHRVKNTLAMTQAIASQSLRHARSASDFVESFSGRVQALAKAHSLLTQRKLEGAELIELVREQVLLGVSDERVVYSGPTVILGSQPAIHLALVLHELATNARKYGALSVPGGRLSIKWEVQSSGGRSLLLDWGESDGPKISAPATVGFGTTLIERTLQTHGGEATLRYGVSGVTCKLRLPLGETGRPEVRAALAALREPAQAPIRHEADQRVFEGRRILIVEDEPLLAMELETNLTAFGCRTVRSAATLGSAVAAISDSKCDAALVDVNLAGLQVDGLAGALTRKDIPFAFVTGYGRDALPAGFKDAAILRKPFGKAELLGVVARLLQPSTDIVRLSDRRHLR